jgi:hypothetical protein
VTVAVALQAGGIGVVAGIVFVGLFLLLCARFGNDM